MAVSRSVAAKNRKSTARNDDILKQFTWSGVDKRGVKMKGEESAKSETALKLDLRKRGIANPEVKAKAKPLFGAAAGKFLEFIAADPLVIHNAEFDLKFINAAAQRTGIKRNPFHLFSTFDTVSLAGLAYGQTVLSRAAQAAGLEWDNQEAHSAIYDAEMTARLFCKIINNMPFTPMQV